MEQHTPVAELLRSSARFNLLGHLLRDQRDVDAWPEMHAACLAAEADAPADALTPLCAELLDTVATTHAADALETRYRETFGHIPAGIFSPYETSYGAANAFTQSQALADLNGFYHAFGVEPSAAYRERPDHVSLECEFVALLLYKEAIALEAGNTEGAEVCRTARRRFLEEHIGWWGGVVCERLERDAPTALYRLCGRFGAAMIAQEREALGLPDPVVACGQPPADGIAEDFCPELFACPDAAGTEQFAC